MKKIILVIVVLIVLGIVSAFLFTGGAEGIEVDMYKSVSCGCCVGHAAYLDGEGFDVNKIELENVDGIKEKYNIPGNMQSCHTTIIGGYFVEGHIPMKAIDRLLEEQPDIHGIALPRMPAGSPGMPGTKEGDFVIYSLDMNGEWEEWMRI